MKYCPECEKNDWDTKHHLIESMEAKPKGSLSSFIFGKEPTYITSNINVVMMICKNCGYLKFFNKEIYENFKMKN